ncbi:MAG: Rieske (2Fe-2S) protein [Candidatus Kryptoniota bacterium]
MTYQVDMVKNGLIKVADSNQLRSKGSILFKIENIEIAVVDLGNEVSAFINSCPHQHTRLVDSSGCQRNGSVITCPMHGWSYDLRNGHCVTGSGRLRIVKLEVKGDELFINSDDLTKMW